MLAGLLDEALAAEFEEDAGDGLAGDADPVAEFLVGEGHGEGDGLIEGCGGVVVMIGLGPVEERAGELGGGGVGEGEAGGATRGAVIVAGHGLSDVAGDVGVGVHEANEVGAGDVLDGGGDQSFRSDEMARAAEQRGEAEDFAGTSDAEAEKAAQRRGGDEFDPAAAQDEDVVGGEALADKKVVGRVTPTGAEGTEIAQC